MAIKIEDHIGLGPSELAELTATLSGLTTLERVLSWARGQTPPRAIDEILTQDEYTHDVVLSASEGRYLVFDTT